ncbi:MAG: HAMP domain-containing protein [Cellvibrionaceae bacterium]
MSDKKIHFLFSVQTKIIFITVFVITMVLGVYAAYEISNQKASLNAEIHELARVTVKKLENNLRIPLWDLDTELAADTVEAEMLTRDISAILIFDSNESDLIVGRQRSSDWDVVDSKGYSPLDKNEIRKEVIIRNQNEPIGKAIVYISDRFKSSDLKSSIIGLFVALLLLDVIIFIVLWIVMTNILRRPISELSEAANQISRGIFTAEIDTSRRDEIGTVANSIERMKVSLNMAISRLRQIDQKRRSRQAQ